MSRTIHRRAIVAAIVRIDKLPVWVSFPLGLLAGVAVGVVIMSSHLGPRGALLAAFALGIALWLGLSAPRPVTPEDSAQPPRGRHARKARLARPVASAGSAGSGSMSAGGSDRDLLV